MSQKVTYSRKSEGTSRRQETRASPWRSRLCWSGEQPHKMQHCCLGSTSLEPGCPDPFPGHLFGGGLVSLDALHRRHEFSPASVAYMLGDTQGPFSKIETNKDLPGGSDGKETACNARDLGLIPGSGRSPEGRHRTRPVFLTGKSRGQRSLAGHSPCGHRVGRD